MIYETNLSASEAAAMIGRMQAKLKAEKIIKAQSEYVRQYSEPSVNWPVNAR